MLPINRYGELSTGHSEADKQSLSYLPQEQTPGMYFPPVTSLAFRLSVVLIVNARVMR